MRAAVYALIVTAVAAAVIEMLAPGGKDGKFGGHIRLIAGLCLLVSLIGPLQEGITILRSIVEGEKELPSVEEMIPDAEQDYGAIFGDGLADLSAAEVEAWISTALLEQFGIPETSYEISVTCTVGENGYTPLLQEVYILLKGQAFFKNPHEIEAYVTEQFGCTCNVAVG